MTTPARQTTDPAREFAQLARFLLQIQGSTNLHSYKVIQAALSGDKFGSAIHRVYSVGTKRVTDFVDMISHLPSDATDEDEKNEALTAIYGMGKLFSADYFHRDWGSVVSECLPKEHLLALAFISPAMSRYYPLPVVQPAEIATLIEKLSEAASKLTEDKEIPLWAQLPLNKGIDDLIFALQNFALFGHDEATSRIIALISTANHTVAAVAKPGNRRLGLIALCTALVLAVDLFAAAPNVSQAYATYRGWMVDAVEVMRPLLAAPQLQLERPKPPDGTMPEDA